MPSDIDLSDGETKRIRELLTEYAAIYREINFEDRSESDIVPRIINHLFINVLGHSEDDYEQENDWNDIIFRDNDSNAVIIVEAKRRSVDVKSAINQGFEYAGNRNYVKYLVCTNLDNFLLYKACTPKEATKTHGGFTGRLIAEINFEKLINSETGRALTSEVSIEKYQNLLEVNKLRREEVVNLNKFENFNLPPTKIQDVSSEEGFKNLLDALEKSINEYFMPYTLKKFDEYKSKNQELEEQHKKLLNELKAVQETDATNEEDVAELQQQISQIETDWEPYRKFWEDYKIWRRLSNRVGDKRAENKRIFCRESVYTQINKILFIRIAEDKGLLNNMVSKSGVHEYFEFWNDYAKYTGPDKDYKDLFDVACTEMTELYEHLFNGTIFDWQLRDGSALNEVFRKTFWHLNHYNFENVDRDLLGTLYEQHLPKEERQTLGEFYTPTEVVNFILDQLNYTTEQPIENKDILDPATGSGTFLVQAANRLVGRLENKGVEAKQALEIVQKRLHGLDINPFAVNIAQINIVFQIIDLYREVKKEHPNYTIEGFKIYQTDSLKRGTNSKISGFRSDSIIQKYKQNKRKAGAVKNDSYDIVIGNPPYVYYNDIPEGQREKYNEAFGENAAHRQYDMSILFIDSVREWLKPQGRVGYITSNKFTKNQYGKLIRKNMPRQVFLREFIDFADAGVFEDATNYPCIFIMQKKTDEQKRNTQEYKFPFVKVKEPMEDNDSLLCNITDQLGNEYEDDYITAFPVSSESLDEQSWKFVPEEDTQIRTRIKDGAEPDLSVGSLCERIESGIKPGLQSAYLVTDKQIKKHNLESEIIHPVLKGEDIQRWRKPDSSKNIIYITSDHDIDKFDNIKSYLKMYKSELEDRTQVDKWWEIREPRPNSITDEKKILTPKIAYYNNFTFLDNEGYPLTTSYYAVPKKNKDYYFLLGLTNSVVMQFYMNKESPKYNNSYLHYYGNIWKEMGVARDDQLEREISKKVKDILNFIDDQKKADKILNNPASVYQGFDVETLPLNEHPAIKSFTLGDEDYTDPVASGTKLKFESLSAEIDFFDKKSQYMDLFIELINMKSFGVVGELQNVPLPVESKKLNDILTKLKHVRKEINTASKQMESLQNQLDKLVLDLYNFDEKGRRLIRKRTEYPQNPLDTRVVSVD